MRETECNDGAKTILLIVSGSIAAYRSLELIRTLKKDNISVIPVLTKGGSQFITPLSLHALSDHPCFTDGDWQKKGMEHIALARKADLILACPASANFIARIAAGLADELATSLILSSTVPVLIAPAMNPQMWRNLATQQNIATLEKRNITVIPPDEGLVACGEYGEGRLAELSIISQIVRNCLSDGNGKELSGKKAIVTAGPTQEAIDPVRFLTNHSSGKQGYAIAEALAEAGAEVVLISGPTSLPPPKNVSLHNVITACEMQEAVEKQLPADIFIGTAAVADWRPDFSPEKLKKNENNHFQHIRFHPNPDILKTLGHSPQRPKLLIGFAAETQSIKEYATKKLKEKNCDWIIANNVKEGVFNNPANTVIFIEKNICEHWPRMSKKDVAGQLVKKITDFFKTV